MTVVVVVDVVDVVDVDAVGWGPDRAGGGSGGGLGDGGRSSSMLSSRCAIAPVKYDRLRCYVVREFNQKRRHHSNHAPSA